MKSEIENNADFTEIRYAQCWEDADILLEALDVKEGGHYISIGSAGDNSFAILSKNPGKVAALDMNQSQLFCVELRKEAYRKLNYEEFLLLSGVEKGSKAARKKMYCKIREGLSTPCRKYWDSHLDKIQEGYIHIGKFENYFSMFRTYILPRVHTKRCIDSLFVPRTQSQRIEFYYKVWNNWRWRSLYHIFFSEFLLGRLGRDKAFFHYVDGNTSKRILRRTEKGFFQVPMEENPYLHYVIYGSYDRKVLPYALREENFEAIKRNIDCLEIRKDSLEGYLESIPDGQADGYNLSDIFEYMSVENMELLYKKIVRTAKPGARVAYWNMLVPRRCPESLRGKVKLKKELSRELTRRDKAYFYSRFLVEEVQ